MFGFSKALIECRFGKKIRRAGWTENEWVQYSSSPQDLLFHNAGGGLTSWAINNTDVLANDWSSFA